MYTIVNRFRRNCLKGELSCVHVITRTLSMGMSVRTWEWGGCHGSREVSGVLGTLVTEKGEGGDA
jgi:hypothetical protein